MALCHDEYGIKLEVHYIEKYGANVLFSHIFPILLHISKQNGSSTQQIHMKNILSEKTELSCKNMIFSKFLPNSLRVHFDLKKDHREDQFKILLRHFN